MCKATPIQHNGLDVVPESILQMKTGARLTPSDSATMRQLAIDLGYPFFMHAGLVYASDDGQALAQESDVFQAALPMCKGKALAAKSIPILPA